MELNNANNINPQDNDKEIINKKKFNFKEYGKKSWDAIYSTFYRFPLTILIFIAIAGIIIYRMEMPYEKIKDINKTLDRIIAVLVLGVPLSMSCKLLIEKIGKKYNLFVLVGFNLIQVAVLILYYLFLFPNAKDIIPVVRLILITFSLTLTFLFIPYLKNKENFEIYITTILTRLIISAFFTIVLALGVMAILFAIKSLLYSGLDEDYYLYTWILSAFVFAPIHFLYRFPHKDEVFTVDMYNKVLKVLILYIVLPIISVYSVVLYLYFAKILITWVWPEGIVSYLVLSYTAVGIASIFLISPLRGGNKWVRIFTAVFSKIIFPLLAMMFVSISIRINEFGFTENRYFILVIGIWASVAMIFINIKKGRNNIVLPVSLAIIAFLTVTTPFINAFSVSVISQNNRFYNILSKYEMIQNGKVVNNNRDIELNDKKEIVGILRYFKYSHNISQLKFLPQDFEFNKMKDLFGFSEDITYGESSRNYFYYNVTETSGVDISGYDILFKNVHFFNGDNKALDEEINSNYGNIKIDVKDKYTLIILRDKVEIIQISLLEHIKSINRKYKDESDKGSIPVEDMIVVSGNDIIGVKILFNNINGYSYLDDQELDINSFDCDVMIKIK